MHHQVRAVRCLGLIRGSRDDIVCFCMHAVMALYTLLDCKIRIRNCIRINASAPRKMQCGAHQMQCDIFLQHTSSYDIAEARLAWIDRADQGLPPEVRLTHDA